MNAIASFRLSTLSDEDLIKKVDQLTDEMYETGKVPSREIPARVNEDYDILVGELLFRFKTASVDAGKWKQLKEANVLINADVYPDPNSTRSKYDDPEKIESEEMMKVFNRINEQP